MFAFQPSAAKRGRDDDSDSDFDEERYTKKSRPEHINTSSNAHIRYSTPAKLPYRPTFTPSPPILPADIGAMTPAQSEYGGGNSPRLAAGGPVLQSQSSMDMDLDMDMDDDEADARSQPPESPAFSIPGTFMRPAMLKPSLFNSDSAGSTGRIPTPIHPTFNRGSMNGLGYPMSGSAGAMSTNTVNAVGRALPMQAPSAWKGPRKELEVDRSRRMPSPISEDEDIPDTPTAFTQSQLSRLSFSSTGTTDSMAMDSTSTTLALPQTLRGRKRSGALTGVGRFSMGFRDDCDKCRQRVPGHYSHFLT